MRSVFFDTNVLFYAYDSSEPEKQSKAQDLIAESIAPTGRATGTASSSQQRNAPIVASSTPKT